MIKLVVALPTSFRNQNANVLLFAALCRYSVGVLLTRMVSLWGVIREVLDTDSSKPSVSYKGHYFKYVGIMRAESHAIHTKAGSLMNKLNKEGPITSGVKIKAFTHALEAGCPFDKAKSLPGFADGIVRNHNAT